MDWYASSYRIRTVADLLKLPLADLKKIRNLGVKSITEIEYAKYRFLEKLEQGKISRYPTPDYIRTSKSPCHRKTSRNCWSMRKHFHVCIGAEAPRLPPEGSQGCRSRAFQGSVAQLWSSVLQNRVGQQELRSTPVGVSARLWETCRMSRCYTHMPCRQDNAAR